MYEPGAVPTAHQVSPALGNSEPAFDTAQSCQYGCKALPVLGALGYSALEAPDAAAP